MPGEMISTRLRRVLNRSGFDVVRHPQWNSVPWALQNLLPRLGVDCVLDVGGHYGEFGDLLRRSGFSGRIVSFEPVPASFERLRGRADADPLWTAYPWALGEEEGELPLHVTEGDVFASFLEPDPDSGGAYAADLRVRETRTVPVRRLDSVLEELEADLSDTGIFLKSDTQGYDFEVLEGLGEKRERVAGIQVELAVQPLYHGMRGFGESLEALGQMGFELYCLSPVTHDDDLRVIEYDCVMRRLPGSQSSEG
jgi:FkbM family methyltransferase